jgi:hypothetical protein
MACHRGMEDFCLALETALKAVLTVEVALGGLATPLLLLGLLTATVSASALGHLLLVGLSHARAAEALLGLGEGLSARARTCPCIRV